MTSRGCCMREAAPSGPSKSWALSSTGTLGSGHWATAHANATKYQLVSSRADEILMEARRRSQYQTGHAVEALAATEGSGHAKGTQENESQTR